jgi:type II secretory pathway pseudopilin PulG
MRSSRRVTGLTLVELLVVIAIIGLLVGMLLPAVQAARESARRTTCGNHLKQLSLAIAQYESQNGVLPPGAVWGNAAAGRRGSLLVHILPHVEQLPLFTAFDMTRNTDGQVMPGTSTPIGATVVPLFHCPTDAPPAQFVTPPHHSHDPVSTVALHNYAASRGADGIYSNGACPCANSWNSNTINAGWDSSRFSGPFTRMGIQVAPAAVRDGLSNTIFMGEIRPLCSWHGDNGWATSNNGQGLCSTVIPINYDTCSRLDTGDNCGRFCNWSTELGFRSAHAGGAFFGFGDGSVRFLSEQISHGTYQRLGAKADGQVIESLP